MPPVLAYSAVPSAVTLTMHARPPGGHVTTTFPCSTEAPAATVITPGPNPCPEGKPHGSYAAVTFGTPPVAS